MGGEHRHPNFHRESETHPTNDIEIESDSHSSHNNADDDIDINEVSAIMSPIRVSNPSSRTTETPRNISLSTASSFSTPAADISFGPQSIPFALRRRELSSSDAITYSMSSRDSSFPHSLRHRISSLAPTTTYRVEEDDESASQMSVVIDDSVEIEMSDWRKEQLKYMKKARMGKNQVEKPIPGLQGPLSLPYARNPR